MTSQVMLTAGEQEALLHFFPSHNWKRGLVKISADGLAKIRTEHERLTRVLLPSQEEAYQAEMLRRVIWKCEQAGLPAVPSATLGGG